MAEHTLKILRCLHRKIVKYVWPFYKIMYERVNPYYFPHIPKRFSSYIKPSCQTLSKPFEKSRNIPLTSNDAFASNAF